MALPKIAPYPLPTAEELPVPKGTWMLEASRAALLIHDMQNYFVNIFTPDAAPITPATANIVKLAACARARGIPVFYTAQNGDQDRRDRGLQADLWGPGMTSAPEHQAIIPELLPESIDFVLVKHRYSAFQRSNLETMMRARGRDQLIVTGIYAHIGCMMTAAEAFQRDIEAFFAADALADFSRDQHDMAIAWVAGRCGIPMTTDSILERLAATGA
ncbi:isochorismatase family protein [Rhizobium sp. SL86]|uniref:isochorismatase family protein n=1 Tax=Rhizobium sp. SL86 TaxID=2995148 RepID=UPI00227463E4|nr:isochorismatase family protein [Rhizobium sp. SL86]MCY1668678.1 isochorismatase family protein [Rhizobium sp. SL86]